MLRHVGMVNFKAEMGPNERDAFAKQAAVTLAQIPGAKNIILGQALDAQGPARYGAALFIDFDDEAALKAYLEHPLHKAVASLMPTLFSESLTLNYLY